MDFTWSRHSAVITSQALNRDVSAAKRAAEGGPVIVTTRGRPTHVMLTYQTFEELVSSVAGDRPSLYDALHPSWLDDHDDGIDLMDYVPPRASEPERELDLA